MFHTQQAPNIWKKVTHFYIYKVAFSTHTYNTQSY